MPAHIAAKIFHKPDGALSNSVVIAVDGAVPSEISEDEPLGYIELEVGNPVMIVNGKRMAIDPDNLLIGAEQFNGPAVPDLLLQALMPF